MIDGPASPIARLAADHEVEALAFARETAPASLPALAESLKIPAKTGDSSLSATDWEPVLARALQSDGSHATVTAVVLLTDGRRNGPIDPLPAIDRLAARGVPVYSILIGSTLPPRDAAVAAVKAPETVYRGDVATVSATIKVDGYPGQTVAVTLDRPGASPLRQTLKAPASAAAPRPVVSFAVPLDQTGQRRYRSPSSRFPATSGPTTTGTRSRSRSSMTRFACSWSTASPGGSSSTCATH